MMLKLVKLKTLIMKYIIRYTIAILFSSFILLSCSSAPGTIKKTKTNLVGTWDNTNKKSAYEFHSNGNGYTNSLDRLTWEVTEPGKFTVSIYIRSLGKRSFDYEFTSMEEFEHVSGSNTFVKKNSIDHIE